MFHDKLRSWQPWLLAALTLLGCGRNALKEVKPQFVINGTETTEFPAVVRLLVHASDRDVTCSGTFISDTLVLTAAACLNGTTNVRLADSGTVATRTFVDPRFDINSNDPLQFSYNLGVAVFPAQAGRAVAHFGKRPAATPQTPTVTLVGFGGNEAMLSSYTDGKKRSGNVTIAEFDKGAFCSKVFVSDAPQGEATAIPFNGDAGAAAFDNGALVGIFSGAEVLKSTPQDHPHITFPQGPDYLNENVSVFVDLNSVAAKGFFDAVKGAGIALPAEVESLQGLPLSSSDAGKICGYNAR